MNAERFRGIALAVLAWVLLSASRGGLAGEAAGPAQSQSKSEHILVTFPIQTQLLNRRAGSGFKAYSGGLYHSSVTTDYLTRRLSQDYPLRVVEEWPIRVLDVHCVLYRVAQRHRVEPLLAELSEDPRVESAQRLQRFQLQSTEAADAVQYNDPYHKLQRTWRELDLAQAHRIATGRGVSIAVIDTAVARGHPDLSGRIRRFKSFVSETVHSPGDFHGTAVAGVMAANANNHTGIVGVAPDTDLMALEACWPVGGKAQCNSFTLAQALSYAIEQRAQIINLSLAGPSDPLVRRLVNAALDRNIVMVAASADRSDQPFPASVPGVISVGRRERESSGVMSPPVATIAAPSREILTTVPGSAYDFASGTSLAAAHVSGVIALLFQLRPDGDAQAVSSQIKAAATAAGGRMVNACELLKTVDTQFRPSLQCTHATLVAR